MYLVQPMVNKFSGSYPDDRVHIFSLEFGTHLHDNVLLYSRKLQKLLLLIFLFCVGRKKSVICVLLKRALESFKNRSYSFMFVFL